MRASHLADSFLRRAGLSLITPQPDTQEPLSVVCWLRWQVEMEWPTCGKPVKQPLQLPGRRRWRPRLPAAPQHAPWGQPGPHRS